MGHGQTRPGLRLDLPRAAWKGQRMLTAPHASAAADAASSPARSRTAIDFTTLDTGVLNPATVAAITSVQLNSPATFGGGTYELWGQK